MRILRGVEAGRVNPLAVADRLAATNEEISLQEPSVGPKCIVTWAGVINGTQFYDGQERSDADIMVPQVHHGLDLRHIVASLGPSMERLMASVRKGEQPVHDTSDIQPELDRLAALPKRRL